MTRKRLGLFTRLVRYDDEQSAAQVYHDALEQVELAQDLGYDVAWVAQHHVDPEEGGLPSPLVFLAHAAARFTRIRLGTAIVTLGLEDPIRVAEDAAVLDTLSGGRLELGFGSGGSKSSFELFGVPGTQRQLVYAEKLARVTEALHGAELTPGRYLHPPAGQLRERTWQATFSVSGAVRAGQAGAGLLLSRTQPRDSASPNARIDAVQQPLIDAYLAALPSGVTPRIGASRSVFVADDRDEALRLAHRGAVRFLDHLRSAGIPEFAETVEEVLRDSYVGTADEVAASLAADTAAAQATDLIVQIHPIDPDQRANLRSIELIATKVAPQLGDGREAKPTGAGKYRVGKSAKGETVTDVIDTVLGSERAAAVHAVRQSRPAVIAHTRGVHDALFDGPAGVAFGRERLAAIAVHIATLAGAKELAAHYAEFAGNAGSEPESNGDQVLAAALRHAARLTTAPASSTRAHIDVLHAAGLTEQDVVTLTQLAGFVNYQIRLLAGLALIGDTHE